MNTAKARARANDITKEVWGLANRKRRRRVGFLTKIAIVVFSVYVAVTLITLQVQINERRREEAALTRQLEATKARNAALTAAIDSELTDEMIKAQAREKLDLVEPGERVFVDTSN